MCSYFWKKKKKKSLFSMIFDAKKLMIVVNFPVLTYAKAEVIARELVPLKAYIYNRSIPENHSITNCNR